MMSWGIPKILNKRSSAQLEAYVKLAARRFTGAQACFLPVAGHLAGIFI